MMLNEYSYYVRLSEQYALGKSRVNVSVRRGEIARTAADQGEESMRNGDESVWAPLKGIKVIDFSMLLPGPLTTLMLADLGAEVIKVEAPGGDYARHMKGAMFEGASRNKKSIVVDLKVPAAAAVLERLAAYGDVAIEGFRPGVAARLGCDAARLQAINPRLVYCSISGFGQTGPLREKAGHDLAFIAMGGGLATRGQLRQPPSRASLPIADIAGGAFAAVAILAALNERDRRPVAVSLDLSLYESVLYASAVRYGFTTEPDSVDHLYPANDLFRCADGRMLALAVVEEKFWHNLVSATRTIAPELGSPAFASEAGRAENAERLMAVLDGLFATRTAEEWVAYFDRYDVPATVCVTNQEAIRSEHARARALHIGEGAEAAMPFPVIASGMRVSRNSAPAPALGADGPEILAQLGFAAMEIDELAARGAVRLPDHR